MSLFKSLKRKITGSSGVPTKPAEKPAPSPAVKDPRTTRVAAVENKEIPSAKPKSAGPGGPGLAPKAQDPGPPKQSTAAPVPTAVPGAPQARRTQPSALPDCDPSAWQRRMSASDLLKPIPSLQDTPLAQRQALLIQKLRLCSITFDWGEESAKNAKDTRAKDAKQRQLLELVEYCDKTKGIFTEPVLAELIAMLKVNIFRALPPRVVEHPHGGKEGGNLASGSGEGEEDDPVFEPSWPHLEHVYEFFIRFIALSDVDIRTLKKHINGQFVLKLLELFDSEDARERERLKTILHRMYSKFMSLRAFIRKAINNIFYVFIHETETHNGVGQLLEILGSIINGFATPLKQEHKSFLRKVLIPMHKVKTLGQFHTNLTYCVNQFVEKDHHLAIPVMLGLIKYWPVVSSAKEVLFLNELEEVLEATRPAEFKQVLKPVFTQLSRSISSPHFQVAERALFFWHNDYVASLIADFRQEILPIIFPVLHENSQYHWNSSVSNLTLNVLKIFQELDPPFVEECQQRLVAPEVKAAARNMKDEYWLQITQSIPEDRMQKWRADSAPPPVTVPTLGFVFAESPAPGGDFDHDDGSLERKESAAGSVPASTPVVPMSSVSPSVGIIP